MSHEAFHANERTVRKPTEQESTETTEETELNECPECGGRIVTDEAHGESVCSECGLVVDGEQIDPGPEWRAFDPGEKDQKSRVGAPTTKMMHDQGLSTNIGWQNKDAYGRSLSSRQRKKMQRLRTWDERFRTRNSKERNLKQALGEIDRMASALGLPKDVRETASVIYRRALSENLLPGRSIEGISTASLYAAVRMENVPRSIDDFASVTRVDEETFKRAYRYIVRELDLEIAPTDPEKYVPRFVSALEVSSETESLAREILETSREANVHSGKSPVGLAAAAIYAAGRLTNEHVTQSEIAEVADVSEVTIRNRYQEMLRAVENAKPSAHATDSERAAGQA
ncbi:MAG TPA: transcription initiation factor IIB [Natrialbaceae archaeon]|nr:transcription initiation factor IIB [Natrialbaceae archaeon]